MGSNVQSGHRAALYCSFAVDYQAPVLGAFRQRTQFLGGLLLTAACSRAPDASLVPAPAAKIAPAVGSIQGRVSLVGALAISPVATNASAERQCGQEVPDRTVMVDAAGGLQGAVAFLDEPAAGSTVHGEEVLHIDQKRCAYEPPVAAVRTGATLEILNSDSLMHNVRGVEGAQSLFNSAMPITGMKIRRRLPDTPGEVVLHCDVHPWMRSVIWTFAHSYFALTNSSGSYSVVDVPAGKHRLTVRHARFPEQTFELVVPAGAAAVQDVAWRAADLRPR